MSQDLVCLNIPVARIVRLGAAYGKHGLRANTAVAVDFGAQQLERLVFHIPCI